MSDLLLGIDLGTTSTKVCLISPSGKILAEGSAESDLSSPQPGWAEADPNAWWENVTELIPACLQAARVDGNAIAGVGVSGMVPAVILLDSAGVVLRPSIQQNDARAVGEIKEFHDRLYEGEVLSQTGSAITQQSVGPKLRWVQKNQPEIWNRIARVVGSYDYLNYRLTGNFGIERNWALESGLFSLQKNGWWEVVLELSQADRSWFTPVRQPSDIVGVVSQAAADETGLKAGIPVVAGSADHVASAFSAGLKEPGELLIKLGGAGDILYVLDELLIDRRLYIDYHLIPKKYLLNGCMASSGNILRWFRDQFAPGETYANLDQAAMAVPPTSHGLIMLPYFLGEKTPLHDPHARGVFMGLTLNHTRAHLYRAVMEGISFGFLHHLEILRSLGLPVTRSRVTNGGSSSSLWPQITSDVLGLPLEHIAEHPGSSLGAAFVAGIGAGVFKGWGEIDRFIVVDKVTIPETRNTAAYQHHYRVYRELYQVNRPIFCLISGEDA